MSKRGNAAVTPIDSSQAPRIAHLDSDRDAMKHPSIGRLVPNVLTR